MHSGTQLQISLGVTFSKMLVMFKFAILASLYQSTHFREFNNVLQEYKIGNETILTADSLNEQIRIVEFSIAGICIKHLAVAGKIKQW